MQVQRRVLCALLFTLCAACSHGHAPLQTGKPVVVTTMSTLRSLIQMVTGDRLDVVNLVPVGSSPEDYQP
ncbi:MAG: zinc ABC transporter substrate-binding protein, partial [Candidatus Eremiobacteraeota bacterium]|nr:zinc ABC transporter substrate-binding protein [Candidatus Eremiobacteraeota bacterium]